MKIVFSIVCIFQELFQVLMYTIQSSVDKKCYASIKTAMDIYSCQKSAANEQLIQQGMCSHYSCGNPNVSSVLSNDYQQLTNYHYFLLFTSLLLLVFICTDTYTYTYMQSKFLSNLSPWNKPMEEDGRHCTQFNPGRNDGRSHTPAF